MVNDSFKDLDILNETMILPSTYGAFILKLYPDIAHLILQTWPQNENTLFSQVCMAKRNY